MKILTITAITALALPLMALGQREDTTTTQGQTNQTETTAPSKGKKMKGAKQETSQQQAQPQTGTNVRGQTNVKSKGVSEGQTGVRSTTTGQTAVGGTTQTNVGTSGQTTTTVNKQEFRTRHSEVFSLGRHPKDFFVQRFGANHVRLIGNTYFAFIDGCWVSVDVDGFVYAERVICQGDPDFVVVE